MRIVNRLMFRNNFKITKHLNRSIMSILIIYNSLPLRSTAIDARYSASTQSKIFDVRINLAEAKFNYVINMSRGVVLLTCFT